MKKYISISVFIILFNINAICQKRNNIDDIPNDHIGLDLGPSLSQDIRGKLYVLSATSYNFKMGYSLGLFYEHFLNLNISYKINISYNSKKVSENWDQWNFITQETLNIPLTYTYNYFTIPLLVKYNLNIKKNGFFIDAGFNLDTYISSKCKGWNVFTDNYETSLISKDEMRRFVLSMAAGFGAKIPIGKKYDMSFEVRDNYGLTRICAFTNASKLSLNSELFIYSIAYHIKSKKK